MRRWNGWGDAALSYPLTDDALRFLRERVGVPTPPGDASLGQALRQVPESRLGGAELDVSPEDRARESANVGEHAALHHDRVLDGGPSDRA